ncbi:histidine kinase [Hymenobacter sp. M29]|uniref:Oxygen sensor histidine kinase NreB n=1 Tax=Hymenobacter mellowenesis TaxID=3063995 RepID=A0ABT9AH46_9BACT|nr:ATP-binding protein [Hymenobacter sp. M29]MDO7849194.1 histidine kinase [Hymenobacter sp. M29]
MEKDPSPESAAALLLLNSEEEFRLFLAASFDIVYKMSADWQYMYRLIGKDFLADTLAPTETWMARYIPAPQQREMLDWIAQAIRAQGVFEHEHQVFLPDGSVGWVQSRAVPVRNAQGEINEWLGTAINVTPRIQAEKALVHQQHAQFIAVQEAEEAERKRIAEGLHNGIGQTLFAVKLRLEQSRVLLPAPSATINELRQETDDLLADAIRQVRALSHELVPMVLEEFGLAAAIKDLCQKMKGVTLRVKCRVQLESELPLLPGALQLALYRIAQELLQNVVRHATGATRASVDLENVPGFVLMRVEDNGPGFPAHAPAAKAGLGLRSIRDRVALLGGVIEVGKLSGSGAYVRLRLPVLSE